MNGNTKELENRYSDLLWKPEEMCGNSIPNRTTRGTQSPHRNRSAESLVATKDARRQIGGCGWLFYNIKVGSEERSAGEMQCRWVFLREIFEIFTIHYDYPEKE